jgi:hypothetical protein
VYCIISHFLHAYEQCKSILSGRFVRVLHVTMYSGDETSADDFVRLIYLYTFVIGVLRRNSHM